MLDDNRDGELSNADFANGVRAALPLGSIADVADASGPDNRIGYAGYLWEQASGPYHVRFRRAMRPRHTTCLVIAMKVSVSVTFGCLRERCRDSGVLHNVLPLVSTPIAERPRPYAVEPYIKSIQLACEDRNAGHDFACWSSRR